MNYLEKQKVVIEKLKNAESSKGQLVSSVPINENIRNDQSLCLTLLSFLPQSLKGKVSETINELKSLENCHYFYPAESLHLTIQNVRKANSPPSFTEKEIRVADKVFSNIFSKKPSLTFALNGLIILPTSISIICYASDSFEKLVHEMRESLKAGGVADDKKYISEKVFFGNVTICRFTRKPSDSFLKQLALLEDTTFGSFNVLKTTLVTTNSVCDLRKTKIINEYDLQ